MSISHVQHVHPGAVLGAQGSSIPEPVLSAVSPEHIETNETDHFRSEVAKAVAMVASSRTARLQSLAQAVRSGAFQPMPAEIADQILAQAELEARLVAYFK